MNLSLDAESEGFGEIVGESLRLRAFALIFGAPHTVRIGAGLVTIGGASTSTGIAEATGGSRYDFSRYFY